MVYFINWFDKLVTLLIILLSSFYKMFFLKSIKFNLLVNFWVILGYVGLIVGEKIR